MIPDSVTTIGDDAFYGCDGLSEIIIPDSVTTIGDYAFGFCDGILNVTFGSGLTTIGKYAFGYCINIKNITIPANVTTIEDGPFYNCESLLNITVDSNNPNYSNDEYGVLFNKDKTTLIQYPIGHTRTSYIIPDGVTTIGNVAFYNCDALTSVTLPNGVKIIEDDAFYDCDGLTEIIIPNSVTKIGGNVLTYITTIIYYGGTANQWKQLLANNPEAEKNYLKDHMVYCVDQTVLPSGTCGDNLIWTYNMLTGVLTISGTGEMYDFEYFVHFDVVDVPWWVYHDDINKIIFENGVTSIGDYAFYGCNNLSEVTMSKNVTEIGDKAFVNCTSLKSCVIPVTVTTLGERAFYNCSGVTDVYYEGTEEQWSNFIVFTPSGAINLYPPFKGATMHYNYHIHRNVLASEQVAPTCTKQGYTTYTCDCGDSYVDYYVDALGHTEETIPAVVPTCTETGLTAGSKCSVCGETLIEQEAVDALGHTPANAVEENYVAPTCTENGSKDIVIYCSVCDDELSRETVVLESTGHADNDCDGYCDMDEELLDPSVECDHICHKDGILGFVWRIINVFNMLFGLNKTCDCGVAHY